MNASALQRVRALPAVFTLSMLAARLDGDKAKAAIYAKRWKDAGMIEPAGPRIGVYYNLIADPQAPSLYAFDALGLVFPEAVVAGETVLHDAGWTTQIPNNTQVIVLNRRSLPMLNGFDFHQRPAQWFAQFHGDIRREAGARLSPSAALVDAWAFGDDPGQPMWQPDIDDLEVDDIDWVSVRDCFERHLVDVPDMYRHYLCAPVRRAAPTK